MYAYSHGGNVCYEKDREGVVDLSANINPLGMPEGVREAINNAIANCERYPDSFSVKLRAYIAAYENTNPAYIFCGNGASDVIFRLPRAIGAKKVMVTAPTFSDYERSALSCGAEIIRCPLSEANDFRLDRGFFEEVRRVSPDLAYVCNPNNPTGCLTRIDFIADLLRCCRQTGTCVAIDECFLDFSVNAASNTAKVFLEDYPELIILKAFTKLFALPGIRLGYAICADHSLIENLYYHGADWPVSNLAQAAGIAALHGAEGFREATAAFITAEREAMVHGLKQLGYRVFETEANYVFLHNPYPNDLWKELDDRNIRIRSCANYHGLDGSYSRIAVSTRENNRQLMCAMQEISCNASGNNL